MSEALVTAFGQELATVIGAMAGGTATVAPAAAPVTGDGWTAVVQADPPDRGAWTVAIDDAGARALTAAVMGLTGEVPATAIVDTLRETLAQATSALSLQDAAGVALRAGDVEANAAVAPAVTATTLVVTCPNVAAPVTVTVAGQIDVPAAAASAPGAPGGDRKAPPAPATAEPDRLDAILDIELPLVVRFGRTELPLRALSNLGPGSVIDLGRSADDPVDLLVSNRVVARGEVVVVGGNYGVRVLDVVSPRDRVRPVEA